MIHFLTTMLTFSTYIYAASPTASKDPYRGLINYPNYFFIETGTGDGNGIQAAIDSGSFNVYYSVEVEPNSVNYSQNRFKNNPNIQIIEGDSALDLSTFLQNVNLPATFWLDAHYGSYQMALYVYNSGLTSQIEPLLEELDQIKDNSIKTHTILIPRINWLLTEYSSVFSLTDIENAIYAINTNYVIEYADAFGETDNVLVAYIP